MPDASHVQELGTSASVHLGRPAPVSKCPSGKRIYGTQKVANRAVTNAEKRGELPPMRHYQCDQCGYWHLSKKKRPPGRRDNA